MPAIRPNHKVLLASMAIVLLAGMAALWAHEGHAPLPSRGATVDIATRRITLAATAREALGVTVVQAGREMPADSILAYASLTAPWDAHGFADSWLSGRITRLLARPGQIVTAGQTLAELEGLETETLYLDWKTARNNLQLAQKVQDVLQQATGAIAEGDIIAAENQTRVAANAVELIRAKWLALGLDQQGLEDSPIPGGPKKIAALPIRSPVSGTIVHTDLSTGKVVQAGEHLFEIVDTSRVWARIGILEQDINRVVPGMQVELRLTAYPGEAFNGVITMIGQALDPLTHLNDAWVEMPNPPGKAPRLLPGMRGQARILMPSARDGIVLPANALINNGVDRFVLLEVANTLSRSEYEAKSVEVLRESNSRVAIRRAGLFQGDRVVENGARELGSMLVPGTLSLTKESIATIGLRTAPASPGMINPVVELPGEVDHPPDRRGAASSPLTGVILQVHARPGQQVQPGDLLADIFSLDLISLQLDLLREHLRVELTGRQLEQIRASGNAASRRRLIETEAAHASALNARDSTSRKLQLLGLEPARLDKLLRQREVIPTLPILAPIKGQITAFNSIIGKSVRADEILFEIHDNSRPLIRALIAEGQLRQVKPGMIARARLISHPGLVLTGRVARSADSLDAIGQTLSAWIDLDQPLPANLRQGQMARVTLETGTSTPCLAVPVGALHREGNQLSLFIQQDSVFNKVPIRLGTSNDLLAGILQGLNAGDHVVISGVEELNTAWLSVR
jgi:RND family efflux transporter MFP subunit